MGRLTENSKYCVRVRNRIESTVTVRKGNGNTHSRKVSSWSKWKTVAHVITPHTALEVLERARTQGNADVAVFSYGTRVDEAVLRRRALVTGTTKETT